MELPPHPADNLYYVNLELLEKNLACKQAKRDFTLRFKAEKTPVNFANAQRAYQHYLPLNWLVYRMWSNKTITKKEYHQYHRSLRNAFNQERQWAFMNLLQHRAMREGLIPKQPVRKYPSNRSENTWAIDRESTI